MRVEEGRRGERKQVDRGKGEECKWSKETKRVRGVKEKESRERDELEHWRGKKRRAT